MNIQDAIKQAYSDARSDLHIKPHPLSPEAIDLPTALRLMIKATQKQRGEWFLLWVGYYILATETNAAILWPEAAIIARSYCAGCGDILCEAYETHCQACKEYNAPAAFGEHPPIVAPDVAEWVELNQAA